MRLDEFVKETILQIAKGVQDAIDEQKGTRNEQNRLCKIITRVA